MTLICGKTLSQNLLQQVADDTQTLITRGVTPGIAVVIVGDDPASQSYVNSKIKRATTAGMHSVKHALPAHTSQADVLSLIDTLNNDPAIHGILVQLPLPKHLDENTITQAITVAKDVDGFHLNNVGGLFTGVGGIAPCTPAGCMTMINSVHGADLSGKNAVVVGRSNIVGMPMAGMLIRANATVSVVHSRTDKPTLKTLLKNADIVVVAVGIPHFIGGADIQDGCTVIDVGINRLPDGSLTGDVDFATAEPVAGAITPVPGGVGLMTVATLLQNTVKCAEQTLL